MLEPIRSETIHESPFPPEEIWPILSKTDWINRAIGLPPVTYDIKPMPSGGTAVTGHAKLLGATLQWQEFPFEWLEPEYYRVQRIFSAGPFAEAKLGLEFHPTRAGGARIHVQSEITPRHAVGGFFVRKIFVPKADKDMAAVIQQAIQFLEGNAPVPLPKLVCQPLNEDALQTGLRTLRGTGQSEQLVRALEKLLREAPDVEITRIRPLALARQWGQSPHAVLRLFLHATRAGLLDLSWEILCPNCRSSRQPLTTSLKDLRNGVHCEACQIKYDGTFDQSVELKFAVNPSVKQLPMQTYCLAGPGGKPHIVSQCLIPPNTRKAWKIPPLTRSYRLRSPHVKQSVALTPDDSTRLMHSPVIVCKPEAFEEAHERIGGNEMALQMLNPNAYPVLLILERMEWSDDILTAARATNLQEFRDLFTTEVISPAEQIVVGQQIILFTDLRGSTAMYCEIGDAPAYALVREHFEILLNAVRQNHGAIVKTIGDAVMAAFSSVRDGYAAVQQMHRELAAPRLEPVSKPRLVLKSSLHAGPCLAVSANEKLDYFGTTINLAARMVDCCKGGDLTISDDLYSRPETTAFLKDVKREAESSEVKFRGFAQPQKVWRVQLI